MGHHSPLPNPSSALSHVPDADIYCSNTALSQFNSLIHQKQVDYLELSCKKDQGVQSHEERRESHHAEGRRRKDKREDGAISLAQMLMKPQSKVLVLDSLFPLRPMKVPGELFFLSFTQRKVYPDKVVLAAA